MKRKEKIAALKTRNVAGTIGFCAAVCLAGIGYVWAKSQLTELGRGMKAMELRLEDLKRRNAGLEQKYAEMCSPRELHAAARRLNLGLISPGAGQMVKIEEPSAPADEQAYASNRWEEQR